MLAMRWGVKQSSWGDAIRASLGAEAGGLGCGRFLVRVCACAYAQYQEATEVRGPARKVSGSGDGWWDPTAQVGALLGVLPLGLSFRFLGTAGFSR